MNRRSLPTLMVLFGLFLAILVALRPLMPLDETRYLSVAWEMRLTGDIFHLTRNFEPYSHKPPLLFWAINLVWLVTGVCEYAARLVGPGFAVLCLWATARLARALWTDRADVTGVLVLAGFSLFAIYGSATMFDAMLSFAVLIGVLCLWRAGQVGGGVRDWALLGLALGFGVLAKGPVVLLHLLPMALLIRLWEEEHAPIALRLKGLAVALAVGLAVVALWLVPTLVTADAAFRHELLWTQSVARMQGGLRHDRPFWFLLALLPLLLFPWGWIPGFWRALPSAVRGDRAMRFLAIWVVSAPVLFSLIVSKQAHYLLPELPAVALMVGRIIGAGAVRRVSFAPWAGLLAGLLFLLLPLLPAMGLPPELTPGMLAASGVALMVLSVLALRLSVVAGHLLLGMGLVAVLHLLGATSGVFAEFDARAMVGALPRPAAGLAVIGMPYNAELNFLARLDAPVALPEDEAALIAWAAAHPEGKIFGPLGQSLITSLPQAQIRFNGRQLGIWPSEAVAGN